MHWVVQENLYKEDAFADLIRALQLSGTSYEIVKVIPFSHEVVPEPTSTDKIIVSGSTALTFIGVEKGWCVFYNENFNHNAWVKNLGAELLNYEAIVGGFGKVNPSWDEFFIRPVEDRKLFAGQIIHREEFDAWKEKTENAHKDGYTTLTPDTEVVVSPLKNIHSEWRFFVVDGKIVTGSLYKRYGMLYQQPLLQDDEVIPYAQKMVDKWQPDRAFVIDVALTDKGYKVIEYNCMNSCGFYKSDVGKIVQAIESMENI
jgi:hypothetical protein